MNRRVGAWIAAGVLCLLPPGTGWGQDPPPESTRESRRAVRKGLNWLASQQNPDGSWGCQKGQPPSVALTALATLALISTGSTPDRGPYSRQIRRGVRWIGRVQSRSGFLTAYDSTSMGLVFEHACGTLLLATLYGMAQDRGSPIELVEGEDPDQKARRRLAVALNRLARMQLEDGAWGKDVRGSSEPGVAAMADLALRTAGTCGVNPGRADIKKLREYSSRLLESDRSLYPTACAVRILSGHPDPQEAAKAIRALLGKRLGGDYDNRMSEWDYMAAFYSVSALIHDEYRPAWRKWFPYVRDHLVRIQRNDGSWVVEYCLDCKVFATALALLTLQMPNRILPSTQH